MVTPMATPKAALDSPSSIAKEGQRIYEEKYKADLEQAHFGEYIAIDVLTGDYYIDKFPEMAIETAQDKATHGIFHLIRIGSPSAFKASFGSRHGIWNWAL